MIHLKLTTYLPYFILKMGICTLLFSQIALANQRVYSLDKLKTIESFAQEIAAGKLELSQVLLNKDSFASQGLVRKPRTSATGDDSIDQALNQIADYFVAPFLTSNGVALLTSDGAVVDPGMRMTVNGLEAQFLRAQAKDYVFVINGKEYTIKYKEES